MAGVVAPAERIVDQRNLYSETKVSHWRVELRPNQRCDVMSVVAVHVELVQVARQAAGGSVERAARAVTAQGRHAQRSQEQVDQIHEIHDDQRPHRVRTSKMVTAFPCS